MDFLGVNPIAGQKDAIEISGLIDSNLRNLDRWFGLSQDNLVAIFPC